MSHDHETAQQTGDLPEDGQEALSALRGIWQAQKQTSADIDESCGNTKTCKSMESVGFQGLVDEMGGESESQDPKSVGDSLRAAWKVKLEREGKASAGGTSVRDLVLGSSEQNKE